VAHAVFQGSLSAAEKDRAIGRFREEVDLLLSTDSGGEGRNLQFCAAMINFDLPWNPMRIEQRIGRIHRIGQEREVFILNLCAQGTVEERLLRILHEKINMFELVVGDMNGILGHLSEERDFSEVILELWLHPGGHAETERGFAELEERLGAAKEEYLETNRVEEELFGEDFQM
jgi:SNF2 family DNA or RNA helicase